MIKTNLQFLKNRQGNNCMIKNIYLITVYKSQLIQHNTLRFISINDFNLDPNPVFRWTYTRLSNMLKQESNRRKLF